MLSLASSQTSGTLVDACNARLDGRNYDLLRRRLLHAAA